MKSISQHADTKRLNVLIDLWETGNGDFEQLLFFARRKVKTEKAIFRKALDEWIALNEGD